MDPASLPERDDGPILAEFAQSLNGGDLPDEFRGCPLCGTGHLAGRGTITNRYVAKNRIYLRCDKCGHHWSIDLIFQTEVCRVQRARLKQVNSRTE